MENTVKIKAKILMARHVNVWGKIIDNKLKNSKQKIVNNIKMIRYNNCYGCLSVAVSSKGLRGFNCKSCILNLGNCRDISSDNLNSTQLCGYRKGFTPETIIEIPANVIELTPEEELLNK